MKKMFLSVLLAIVFLGISTTQGMAEPQSQYIVFNKTASASQRPTLKSPPFIPVVGWYDAEAGTLELTFLQDLEEVSVSINGMTYSAQGDAGTTESFDAQGMDNGVCEIVISSSRGTYLGYIYAY